MRFFLDENVNQQMARHLNSVFVGHEFHGIDKIGAKGLDDTDLFPSVAAEGFDAFVTSDFRQLSPTRMHERGACRDAGLHWIGVHQVHAKGFHSVAGPASTLVHAVPFILETIKPADPPRYFVLKKSERRDTQIFKQHGFL
ncbi:hypothetical protein XU06_31900 (plasmid) [Rhodococcus erythropolis]|uniref:PIN-like domain-containing protein n=1 Tax=Rhodococcus erythropolis TaxID=1833 RepID=UPI00061B62F5|nr:hypothetical protein [Rhodococcus erythropolis]AKE01519.1 hypothetical protein XU06_31900 [Rhodococcus erythropolis]